MRRIIVFICATIVASAMCSSAYAGNSDAAKACQKGGHKNWVRTDGTTFKNTGDCVSYVARGGVLTSPTPPTPSISLRGVVALSPHLNEVTTLVSNFAPFEQV